MAAALVSGSAAGRRPLRILQAIASGLLGAESFKGGLATAALGVLLHFSIATGAAAVYYAASRKLRFMTKQFFVSGLIYGLAVYVFMNAILVPLSAAPFRIPYTWTGLGIHLSCVGLPIALVMRRYPAK